MLKFDDEVWVMCYPQGQEAHLVEGTIVSGDSDTYLLARSSVPKGHSIR